MEAVSEDRPLTAQKNMELMIRVSDPLARSTDIRETLKEILNWVFELLVRIDMAAILLDPEREKIRKVIYRMREGVDDQRFSTEVLEHVMQLKEALMISDADTQEGEEIPDTRKLLNTKSVMCVPLLNRAKRILTSWLFLL